MAAHSPTETVGGSGQPVRPPGGLLVIGDIVTDTVVRHGGPLAPGTDTEAAILVRPGGSGANTAAWAGFLGADVGLLARVGADDAHWHERELRRNGVRPVLRVDPGRATARVVALVDGSGERTMVTDRGASGALSPDDWDDALLDGVTRLHLSGYTLFTPSGQRLAETALAAAHRRPGIRVSVDPGSTGFLEVFGLDRFLDLTRTCGTVLANEPEAVLLSGDADVERAASRLGRRYGLAVVKRGALGAVLGRRDGDVERFPPEPVSPEDVIDTVGAGDAFAGGFLAARLTGLDTGAAVSAGGRAGALAVTVPGGRPPQGPPSPITTAAPCGQREPRDLPPG